MEEIIVKVPAKHKALADAVQTAVERVTSFEIEAQRMRTVDYRVISDYGLEQ